MSRVSAVTAWCGDLGLKYSVTLLAVASSVLVSTLCKQSEEKRGTGDNGVCHARHVCTCIWVPGKNLGCFFHEQVLTN